jgi:hypothetical protein
LPATIELKILERHDDFLLVKLEEVGTPDPSRWVSGFYNLTVSTNLIADHPPVSSNALALPVAPMMELNLNPREVRAGAFDLEVTCQPGLRRAQVCTLIFGDQPVALNTPLNLSQPSKLRFKLKDIKAANDPYTVRLRVDGVDSLPIRWTGTPPLPEFDPNQQVKVIP